MSSGFVDLQGKGITAVGCCFLPQMLLSSQEIGVAMGPQIGVAMGPLCGVGTNEICSGSIALPRVAWRLHLLGR